VPALWSRDKGRGSYPGPARRDTEIRPLYGPGFPTLFNPTTRFFEKPAIKPLIFTSFTSAEIQPGTAKLQRRITGGIGHEGGRGETPLFARRFRGSEVAVTLPVTGQIPVTGILRRPETHYLSRDF